MIPTWDWPLCINCKHHSLRSEYEPTGNGYGERRYERNYCSAMKGKSHPISGGTMDEIECTAMRLGWCGLQGAGFEEKGNAA